MPSRFLITTFSDLTKIHFHDFKSLYWGELASLTKHKSGSETGLGQINYETAFIRSLEHRIISLEKQLEQKQQIIEKLLINNNTQVQALLQKDKAMKPSTKGNLTVNKASLIGVNRIESEINGQ